MQILGVRIDEVTKSQALEKAREFLLSGKPHKIFTPNPEMLVDAQKDADFKTVLNNSDLNLCDGFGLWLATSVIARSEERATRQSKSSITRITGADFMIDLCALSERKGKSIYLLGSGSGEVVKKTALVLQEKFPCLRIVGFDKGHVIRYLLSENSKQIADSRYQDANENVLYDIIIKAPDILFVAFGHGKQEKWIAQNLRDLPSVKIAMGVGGAFDFISGHVKRAPKFMRQVGLEWVWRLVREPKRIGRIRKATLSFSWALLRSLNFKKQDTNK